MAVFACFLAARKTRENPAGTSGTTRIWIRLGFLLFLLGFNQQLDLQTLMIEAGRALASAQGWYEYRRIVQKVFFGVFAISLVAFGIVLAVRWRTFFWKHRWVTAGLAVLLGFILMRAASIDHLNEDSFEAMKGAAWKDYLELSGLVLIIGGVWRSFTAKLSDR